MRHKVSLVCALLLMVLGATGCATCPSGQCRGLADIDSRDPCDCDYCGSDGILPNGYPCDNCGPKLPNPLANRPFRSYFQRMLTCGGGCQEVYWDEWLNDPPDSCDPCETSTPGCAGRTSWLASFWATFCGDCDGDTCDGDTCGDDDCLDDELDEAAEPILQPDHRHGRSHHQPASPTRARSKPAPLQLDLEGEPTSPPVPSDNPQPDQKAQHPRRVIRR